MNEGCHVSVNLDGSAPLGGHAAAFLYRLGLGIVRHGPVIVDVVVSSPDGLPELSAIVAGMLVPTLSGAFVASVEDVSMLQWLRAQPDGCEIKLIGSTKRWLKVPRELDDPPNSVRMKRKGRTVEYLRFDHSVHPRYQAVDRAFGLAASTAWLGGKEAPRMLAEESIDMRGAGTSCCALLLGIPPTRRESVEQGRISFCGPGFHEEFNLSNWIAVYDPARPGVMYRSVILGEAVGIREVLQPLDSRSDTSPRIAITATRQSDEIRKLAKRQMREGRKPWLSHCAILPAARHSPESVNGTSQDLRAWGEQCRPEIMDGMRSRMRAVLEHAGAIPSGIKVLCP